MVRLGQRVDHRIAHAEIEHWRTRLMVAWIDLDHDIRLAAHHRKRVERLSARLSDPALMQDYPEGSAERIEAENVRDRHQAALRDREDRISESTWEFPAFWKNRPPCADRWLREEFFRSPSPDETDPVIEYMRAKAPAWKEIAELWDGHTIAGDPCPF